MRIFLSGHADTGTLGPASRVCSCVVQVPRPGPLLRDDVISADVIRQLPAGRAVVIRDGLTGGVR
jgi:hypothetical protein